MTHGAGRRLLWMGLLCVALAGCGRLQAERAQNDYTREQTEQYVYDTRCDELWSEVRELVFEEGYSVQDIDQTGGLTLETE